MSFKESLINNGYKKIMPDKSRFNYAIASYHKTIVDKKGVKFVIHGYEYPGDESRNIKFVFKAQLELRTGDSFDVETTQWFFEKNQGGHSINGIDSVESLFNNIWKNLQCKYTELYS